MGTTNISRLEGRHKKRDIKVFFAELTYDEFPTTAEVYQLARLPEEIIVLSAAILPIVTNNAGTSLTGDLGWAGGSELLNDANLKTAAGTVIASTALPLHLPTGAILTLTPTYGGAAATAGRMFIYLEYLEYPQCTGELTNFV